MRALKTLATVVILVSAVAGLAVRATAEERAVQLDEHFKPFEFLVGKTWEGVFSTSTPEKPMVDVATWEVILDGKVLHGSHALNGGEYAGETMVVWDAGKNSLVYFYFTNAGFYTKGTMSVEGDKITSHEFVEGHPHITEVRAEMVSLPDGSYKVSSFYLTDGKWIPGHEAIYKEKED